MVNLKNYCPELLKYWDSKKNIGLYPEYVDLSQKYFWKCPVCKKEWQNTIEKCARALGCLDCAFSSGTSFSEQVLFYLFKVILKENVYNRYKFNNLKIGKGRNDVEADIYFPSKYLVIEYDGMFWHGRDFKIKLDIEKEDVFSKNGINLFRIVESKENKIVDNKIFYKYSSYTDVDFSWAINNLLKILNYSYYFNVSDYIIDIANFYFKNRYEHSIAVLYPKLMKEWDYEKNGVLAPTILSAGSRREYWWKCSKGHEWKSTINKRTDGHDCFACYVQKKYDKLNSDLPGKFWL